MAIWLPRMFDKQFGVFNSKKRSLLVSGPRKSGKTRACIHKFLRHMWETPGATCALVAKTIKSAKDSGVWTELLTAVEEWRGSGIGFDFTSISGSGIPGPRSDAATKTVQFSISNMYGGTSIAYLFSIDNDNEVEHKMKSTVWSMIWFSELSNFKSVDIYRASILQLRSDHLRFDQLQWMADTNPSVEGEDSWIFDYWYRQKNQKDHPFPKWQANFGLIEIFIEDNPFVHPEEIEELEAQYADDPGALDRYRWGKWTRGTGDQGLHFADKFSRQQHVIGTPEEDSIEIDPGTIKLFSGWDLGSANNSACILMEKRIVGGISFWMILREIVMVEIDIGTADFTELVVLEMDRLDIQYRKKFEWKHWSDDSAINVYRASADTYDYLTVRDASDGKIELDGVMKPGGSVRRSVQMIRQLIKEGRIFVSLCCPYTISMFEQLRQGDKPSQYIEPARLKHGFDALRYPIFMESLHEMEISLRNPTADSIGVRSSEF